METVDCFINLYEQGWPASQMQIEVYPKEDQAFKGGITATISFEDINGIDHQIVDDDRIAELLADIKAHDPDKWLQIESAARLNSRPDYEDCEPVSYAAHYAEDELSVVACPR